MAEIGMLVHGVNKIRAGAIRGIRKNPLKRDLVLFYNVLKHFKGKLGFALECDIPKVELIIHLSIVVGLELGVSYFQELCTGNQAAILCSSIPSSIRQPHVVKKYFQEKHLCYAAM
jgi:hypothetical protein